MCAQEEHGFDANIEAPVTACKFAERFIDAANGWRFGIADKFRLAAAAKMAFVFKLAAAFAAAENAADAEACREAVPVAEPEAIAVKFACAVARAALSSMPAFGLAKFPPSN